MSHLDIPRIVLAEEFQVNLSTANNDARTVPWQPNRASGTAQPPPRV